MTMNAQEIAELEAQGFELDARYEEALARYKTARDEWQAKRVAVAAELLGMPPEQVTEFLVGFCVSWFGKPDGWDSAPCGSFEPSEGASGD